jgi:hypothetical protein
MNKAKETLCLLLNKNIILNGKQEANQYNEEFAGSFQTKLPEISLKKIVCLTAPINGSLQNITGLQKRNFMFFSNQKKLGKFLPMQLTAFCYTLNSG